ncbi:hypothetical protein DPMN_072505 [Dreissena polymorpha]|uniref:Uncharacterized protein n=1 Tax=Dreissena polymorpha TaxID=45954 RepID=A0A9D3Z6C5_DREPO|nr:hypothetical protein DPMN_072505 [Dreissena polymorpha]
MKIGPKIVTSRKNAPPTGGSVFSPIRTMVELVQEINKTHVLTKFHDDWAKIVTSTVKIASPTVTYFELRRDIIGVKFLIKFHDDGTTNQMLTDGRTDDGQKPLKIFYKTTSMI